MANSCFFTNLGSGGFRDAALCGYQNTIGGPEFALLAFGMVAVANYYRSGSVLMPAVLVLIVGGRLLSEVAGIGATYVQIALVAVFTVAPILVLRKIGRI